MARLQVANLSHIARADIDFGDFTVLVGPQATGKSLLLQTWKLVQDRGEIVSQLRLAGFTWRDNAEFLQLLLGQGWGQAWRSDTAVIAEGKKLSLATLRGLKGQPREEGRVFYIPAHRTLVLDNGWPQLFGAFTPDTPYVVRRFSQVLHGIISQFAIQGNGETSSTLFPLEQRLKAEIKHKIDEAVFHGARLTLMRSVAGRQELGLEVGDRLKLGFMSWTAGQREVSPLLLSLYHLLPAGKIRKRDGIDWVVLEEPEMGLHPKAILAVLMLTLDLVARGYRVILSTHAPVVLDLIFGIHHLQQGGGGSRAVLKMFDLKPTPVMDKWAQSILAKEYRVFALDFDPDNLVRSKDISGLDPASEDEQESGWGGLTGFSSQINRSAFES